MNLSPLIGAKDYKNEDGKSLKMSQQTRVSWFGKVEKPYYSVAPIKSLWKQSNVWTLKIGKSRRYIVFNNRCPYFFQNLVRTSLYTMSWGCWKHVFGIPGARPMFLKAELHKESKNGFKTINSRPPSVMIFSKNCFWSKKIIKKIGRFVNFWIFMAIYMNNLDQF